ncbi:MAG: DNA translocase FtsK [Candidatus Saganbacteria bacterium]|nr:DNA translocase FtsK [Candidatus Saganbacteria bacterium]
MAKRKSLKSGKPLLPPEFKQDLVGIIFLAAAAFILISNLSSATGWIGLYLVKTVLLRGVGVGVFALPFFMGLYGIITLIRHEIKEISMRLAGLIALFLTLISFFQFFSPEYFGQALGVFAGAGGVIGYGVALGLSNVVGVAGAYIILTAVGLFSSLLVLNVTLADAANWVFGIFIWASNLLLAAVKFLFTKHDTWEKPKKKELKKAAEKPVQAPLFEQKPEEVRPEPIKEKLVPQKFKEISIVNRDEDEGEPDKKILVRHKKVDNYKLPPMDILEDPTKAEKDREKQIGESIDLRKKLLEESLRNFGVGAQIIEVSQGPAVTRFEIQPDPGVKVSRIVNLADDIALNLATGGVRIEGPIPGKNSIGIEVPNPGTVSVHLKTIINRPEFQNNESPLFVALGMDLSGTPIYADLTRLPHLLIAGTTGSGKSVCVNALITSILMRARPDEVKMVMIDPKMVELSVYDGIPHLLAPVVTEPRRAARMLKDWVIKEMERRYHLFHASGARNIQGYNNKVVEKEPDAMLPYIVVIIDELADMMMAAANEVETTICRLAQMARATGIHLVIATQRPSVDVITGLIKANIPSRIAFAVATQIDSRVILDTSGAEKLLGRGDMLYNPVGAMKPIRLQGGFVTDKEVDRVVKFIKDQAPPEYLEEIVSIKSVLDDRANGDGGEGDSAGPGGRDSLFGDAAKLIIESGQASTSHLQRRFSIGYNRAARIMDEMEAEGVVSKPEGPNKPRRILASLDALKEMGIDV